MSSDPEPFLPPLTSSDPEPFPPPPTSSDPEAVLPSRTSFDPEAFPPSRTSLDEKTFDVPLDGYTMHLRRSELELVATGLGEFDASREGNLLTLAEALRSMPLIDRAPVWELAVRRYGRHKPLEQAAGEIGMDAIRGRALLEAFSQALAAVPPPENRPTV
jgi:hypothetical protein